MGAWKAAATIGGSSGEPSLKETASAMEAHPLVADPPEVTLFLLREIPSDQMQRVEAGTVSSTDKGLIVLYTGTYRPGNGAYSPAGCYLIYDASINSLSAIPQLDRPAPEARFLFCPLSSALGPALPSCATTTVGRAPTLSPSSSPRSTPGSPTPSSTSGRHPHPLRTRAAGVCGPRCGLLVEVGPEGGR